MTIIQAQDQVDPMATAEKVKVLHWPSQSTDLNILEPLVLNHAVCATKTNNVKNLKAFRQKEWAAIPPIPQRIKNLIHNYYKD